MSCVLLCLQETKRATFAAISSALKAKNVTYDVYDLPGGGRVYRIAVSELPKLEDFQKDGRGLTLDGEKLVFRVFPANYVQLLSGFTPPEKQYWVANV